MYKKIFITIIIAILTSTTTYADFNLPKAIKAYNHNLDSNINGVIESSLVFITKLRFSYPEANFKESLEKIDTLLEDENNPTLHYKLFLTKIILSSNTNNLVLPVMPDQVGPTEFFIRISEMVFRNTEITRI